MKVSYPRLPRNKKAVVVLLASLLICGNGLVSWHKKTLYVSQARELTRASQASRQQEQEEASVLPDKPAPEALRRQEQIDVEQKDPTPDIPADAAPIAPAPQTVPVISHIQTNEPVVFLTIDDGVTKDPNLAEYISERQLPITTFLTISVVHNDFDFFGSFVRQGDYIENHTITHPHLPKYPYETQRREICDTSDILQAKYGMRPTLFRPPYGEYNPDTLKAAAACGIKTAVVWDVVVTNGVLSYQTQPGMLKPGDIILLHYRPELKSDLEATLKVIHDQGFKIARLEDWLQ